MWRTSKTFLFIVFAIFFVAVFLFSLHPIRESDTGFIIRTGEYVWNTGLIPHTDIFSFTAPYAPWVAHYWLPGLFFFFFYSLFGAWGVILFVGCIGFFTFFTIFKTVRLFSNTLWIPFIIFFFFFSLTFNLWSARPQIFSYLFTSLLLYIIFSFKKNRVFKKLLVLPPLLFLWANMHAGVILGIALLLLFLVSEVIREWRVHSRELFLKGGLIISSILLTLLNPNGFSLLTYSQDIASTAKELGVMEWFSIFDRLSTWQAKTFILLMCISLAFILWNLTRRKINFLRNDFFEIGLVLFAFILPFISIRHIIFFPILVFPLFLWTLEWHYEKEVIHTEGVLRNSYSIPLVGVLILCVVAGGVLLKRDVAFGTVDERVLPVGAVDFILRENISGPFFNLENGGYLIWKLWPQEKVFLDGRNEVYKGLPTKEYISIARQEGDWKEIMNEKYKINGMILWYRAPLDIFANNLVVNLLRENEFTLVYWDDAAIVLVRNVEKNREIIKKFGYMVINPFRNPASITANNMKIALDEIVRARAIVPRSVVLEEYEYALGLRVMVPEKLVQ